MKPVSRIPRERGFLEYFGSFLAPVLLGSAIGGVFIVAALNHAQVVTEQR